MEADEAGTLARLRAARGEVVDPSLAAHGGRLVKTTGDGFLVEFPSAVAAVECAVAIQRAMATRESDRPENERLSFRVGVNLGDIIVEREDILGDGVNIAARLEALAEPGSIYVSEKVQGETEGRVDVAFVDVGKHLVKNIARPIHAYRIASPHAWLAERSAHSKVTGPRLAIAVLPFENLSNDPEQQYFADGIAEDVTNALTSWRYLPVISRTVSFAYRNRSFTFSQIARELNVQYLVTGSVRKSHERLRVTIQLTDATTGLQIWTEKYDRNLEQIFEIQDDITQRVAATIAPELEQIEGRKSFTRNPSDLAAWDCCQRGMALLHQFTKVGNQEARTMLLRAVEIDAGYSKALTGLAYSYHRDLFWDYAEDRERWKTEFLPTAQRAVQTDEVDSSAHVVLAYADIWHHNYELALAHAEQAVALNQGNAFAHIVLGEALDMVGRREDACRSAETGIELNKRDPRIHTFYGLIARIHLGARAYKQAETWARRTIHRRADYPHANVYLAATLALQGRIEEARQILRNCDHQPVGLALCYQDPADNAHVHEGLQKAGWMDPRSVAS